MLFYWCDQSGEWERIRMDPAAVLRTDMVLRTSLPDALAACSGRIFVLDGTNGDLAARIRKDVVVAGQIPHTAILNGSPYLPPRAVTAAGGLIARLGSGEPEVLLIFRRGAWDLPKGKLDEGEAIPACALREVKEEIGVRDLEILEGLGTTVHGYAHGGAFLVKTTHWFLMRTPETDFTPQAEEGIETVAWVPWSEAVRRVGYETLRRHLVDSEEAVRAGLEQAAR